MWLIAVVFFGSIAVYISIMTIIDIMLMGKITNCKYYNRRIEKKFFLQLWNTAMLKQPLFRNTFYVVTKYNTKKGE